MRASIACLGLVAYLCSSPALASEGEPVEEPPKGKGMYGAGLALTVTGAVQLAGGTVLFALSSESGAANFYGIHALVLGGGFVTMGALLMHFGEERRFAYHDWKDGRAAPKREYTRRRGAGAILAGTLTLAGGAAGFAVGASKAPYIGQECVPAAEYCIDFEPVIDVPALTIGAAGMALGSVLLVVGIRNRSRYLDWRVQDRRVVLQPTGGASARGAFFGLSGRF